jgi:hypothetical protein
MEWKKQQCRIYSKILLTYLEFLYTVCHFIIIIFLLTYLEFLYTFNYFNNIKDTSLLNVSSLDEEWCMYVGKVLANDYHSVLKIEKIVNLLCS